MLHESEDHQLPSSHFIGRGPSGKLSDTLDRALVHRDWSMTDAIAATVKPSLIGGTRGCRSTPAVKRAQSRSSERRLSLTPRFTDCVKTFSSAKCQTTLSLTPRFSGVSRRATLPQPFQRFHRPATAPSPSESFLLCLTRLWIFDNRLGLLRNNHRAQAIPGLVGHYVPLN